MKINIVATLLLITTAAMVDPAFASGYGPAPFYRPNVGAPASQRGQSAQTLAAEHSSTEPEVRSDIGRHSQPIDRRSAERTLPKDN